MSAAQSFLQRLEQMGLLDEKILTQLRKQIAEARGAVAAETLAKVLVDNGHLTVFQAKKIVAEVATEREVAPPGSPPAKAPSAGKQGKKPAGDDDLGFADDADKAELQPAKAEFPPGLAPVEGDEGLEPIEVPDGLELLPDDPPPKPVAPAKPTAPAKTQSPPPAKPAAATPAAAAKSGGAKAASPAKETAKAQPTKAATSPAASKAHGGEKASAAKPAPPSKPAQDKASVPAPMPTPAPLIEDGLTPLGTDDLEVLDESALSPLDASASDPLSDPLLATTVAQAASPLAGPQKARPKAGNQWDSALIYVGGGALVVLVLAFGVLYLTLARGSAKDAFELAETDYSARAYSQAMAKYDKYLARYSSDVNASLARVRIGVCQIHLAVDNTRDWVAALATTQETLQQIEAEPAFDEARAELADLLPRIAGELVQQARGTTDVKVAGELAEQADKALALVNDGAYIPPSLRGPVESKVSAIQEELSLVKRELNRDAELSAAIAEMGAAVKAGDAAKAYAARRTLLQKYPGLDVHEKVGEATRAVTQKERSLVVVKEQVLAATTEPRESVVGEAVFGDRSGEGITTETLPPMAWTVKGSAWGVEGSSGRLLWRQHLGSESVLPPVPVSSAPASDWLLCDAAEDELWRVKAADGALVWRLPVGEAFFAPLVRGGTIYLTTRSGKILEIDAASGASKRRVVLPQGALQTVAGDAQRPVIYQLGEHSTLFAISTESLECAETFFVGHSAGSIGAPPVMVGGQLFVGLNVGADFSLLHLLATDAEGLTISKKQDALRLKGQVITPPAVDGRRVYFTTSLGSIQVLDVDPANIDQPVRTIARLLGSRTTPVAGYLAVSEGRVWLGDERLTMYELQPSKEELARRWSRFEGEEFLAPPRLVGETLFHVRQRRGASDVTLCASAAADGAPKWQASIAAPVVKVTPTGERVMALLGSGAAFVVTPTAPGSAAMQVDAAARVPAQAQPQSWTEAADVGAGQIVLAAGQGPAQWAAAAVAASPELKLVAWAGHNTQFTASPIALESLLLLPLNNAQIAAADPQTGKSALYPFQPRLEANRPLRWVSVRTIRGGDAMFAAADDHGQIYLVQRKEQPQPQLALVKQVALDGTLQGELAQCGDQLLAIVQKDRQFQLQAYSLPDLTPQPPVELTGGLVWGPVSMADAALVVTSAGLACYDAGPKLRWSVPLEGTSLGAPPIAHGEDWLCCTTQGEVLRVARASGEVRRRVATGRPLTGTIAATADGFYLAGADGAVYQLPSAPLAP